MAKSNSEEKEDGLEARKILTKKINFFLSNYFGWFIFLAALAILIFGFFSLLKPKYEQTVKYLSIINQQGTLNFEAKQAELKKMKDLLAAYKSLDQKAVDKIKFVAPVKKNKEELFTEINYLAYKSQLSLQSVSLSEGGAFQDKGMAGAVKNSPAGKIEAVKANLSLSGADYPAFKNFLSILENNLRLIDIINLSFDPRGQSVSLAIEVYYLGE